VEWVARLHNNSFLVGGSPTFEGGGTTAETAPTISTERAYGGGSSLKMAPSAKSQLRVREAFTGALERDTYYRFYVYAGPAPGANNEIFDVMSGSTIIAALNITPSGEVKVFNKGFVSSVASSAGAFPFGRWTRLEIRVKTSTSANSGTLAVKVDGATVISVTNFEFGTTLPPTGYHLMNQSSGGLFKDLFFAGVAVNDSVGEKETVWVGAGKFGLLRPAADQTNSNFKVGAAKTSNLYKAVSSTPPLGVAFASRTETSQIYAEGVATYETALAPYTAPVGGGGAGMGASDPLRLVQGLFVGGNSTSTSRTIAGSLISNPAIAEVTTGSGTTAAGTHPTGWTLLRTPVTYAPTVTLGTAPVARVRRTLATADALMYDLIGLLVEFEPLTVAEAPSEPVFDDCSRANENPLSQAGQWVGVGGSTPPLKLESERIRNPSTSEFAFATSRRTQVLWASEIYVKVTATPSQLSRLWVRADGSTSNGYFVDFTGGKVKLNKLVAGKTTLLKEVSREVKTNGVIGLTAKGSLLAAWYREEGAAEWELVATAEDTTFPSGYIGLGTNSPNTRYDDVGGGGFLKPTAGLKNHRLAIATTLVDPIVHPDKIVVCQWWHAERIEAAQKVGAKVLIYQNMTRVHEADKFGHYSTGLTIAEAEALGVVSGTEDPDAGMIVYPNENPKYKEQWAEKTIARAKEVGADGILCDDMNSSHDGVGEHWDEEVEAMNAYVGPAITAAGLLGIPNMDGCIGQRNLSTGGWLERQFAYFDGGLDEFFVTFPGGSSMSVERIEEAAAVMRRQQFAGKLYLANTNGSEAQQQFALGLCLIFTAGGVHFFGLPGESPVNYGKESWTTVQEKALALGLPTADPQKTATGWSRQYENGSVSVDIAAKTASF
jgi:hypothetical protein